MTAARRVRCRLTMHKPTFNTWRSMHQRCYSQSHGAWHRYGGRGITVCKEWGHYETFLADMGERPDGHTLDRINNDGNYEPGNCRWATQKQQCSNTSIARLLTFNGETHPLAEWARRLDIYPAALRGRLRRMPLEEALTRPKSEQFTKRKNKLAVIDVETMPQRLSIGELLSMYDDSRGDWCAIARAVEDRYASFLDKIKEHAV